MVLDNGRQSRRDSKDYPNNYQKASPSQPMPPYENEYSSVLMAQGQRQLSNRSSGSTDSAYYSQGSPNSYIDTSLPSSQYFGLGYGANTNQQVHHASSSTQSTYGSAAPLSGTTLAPPERSKDRPPGDRSDKAYLCLHESGCERKFKRYPDLQRHMNLHFPDNPNVTRYDCEQDSHCGRYGPKQPGDRGGFTRRDHYIEHRRKVHMENIPKGRGSGKASMVRKGR